MWDVLQLSFMRLGMIASALVGIACGYLSVYVVLKRLVFLAIALAQVASAAAVLGMLCGVNTTASAFVGVSLGALFFAWPGLARRLPRENAIGTAYALASAAGVLLVAKQAQGEEHLLHLLYGNVLTVTPGELWLMGAPLVLAGTMYLRFAKEFLISSFDPEMARTLGIRSSLWEVLFYLSLGLVIAMAIRLGGMLLVFALLVLPGYAALLAECRVRRAFAVSALLAVVSGVGGLLCSFWWDLPTSAVTVAGLCLAVVLAAGIGALRRWGARRPPAAVEPEVPRAAP